VALQIPEMRRTHISENIIENYSTEERSYPCTFETALTVEKLSAAASWVKNRV
jgi:hypothetical protein